MNKDIKAYQPEELINILDNGSRSDQSAAFGQWLPKRKDGNVTINLANSISVLIKHYQVWMSNLQSIQQSLGADIQTVQRQMAEDKVKKLRNKYSAEVFEAIKAAIANV